ncbi:Ferric siderophore transport system, biopolymer transport protein ExbB [Rhodopirellula islandica]|uniref:Ferric siderophore transport system, biopolymer transport protein ExbB n=1 Tax=Rhodopirellula islandica TaxID=595434 RepID=A0A0J1BE68_RHOIS|nr:MotA/TolQ/ExbB proton channel family protein [Rhodopirellula islandica]KLU04831.1 Ferric siderophore transport system, biopolymer transport protein ExbB [Rhodopirellula islandica]
MNSHRNETRPNANRVRPTLAVASRFLPVVVLTIGLSIWSNWHGAVIAQNYGNQGFNQPRSNNGFGNNYNTPYNSGGTQNSFGGGQFGASQPVAQIASNTPGGNAGGMSIPEAPATDQLAGEGEAADGSEASWEPPAFISKIAEGGMLMIPLAVCSLIVLGLSMERMIALRRSRVIPKPFVRRFTECVEDGQLSYEEATSICDEFDCPVAEVFHAAVRRWGRPMMEIEQAVIDAGDRVGDSLRRFLRVFHAISNVTPLIGLLGTVLGMIQAFETIADPSAGESDLLASGISTALMTTAGGLSVAIPAYLAYMYFGAKSDGYLGEIDKLCQRVIDCISAEGLENAGTAKAPRKRRAA